MSNAKNNDFLAMCTASDDYALAHPAVKNKTREGLDSRIPKRLNKDLATHPAPAGEAHWTRITVAIARKKATKG
jgi:hypothetical protein